jgi:predicted dehydrogenase
MTRAMHRRHFLQQAAVAVGAMGVPLPIASSVLGKDGATAPSNTITLGCIGLGRLSGAGSGGQGGRNMKSFLLQDDCRVVAVCDAYKSRREEGKKIIDESYADKGCATYADYRELLARKDIDAVMIATQDHWHALIATAAAAAGKDMYCEKPMGVSVEQSQKIVAGIRKHGRVFQGGTQQRSSRNFRFACELARNGYIGKLHTVQVSAPGPEYQPKYDGPLDPQPAPEGFDWNMWRGPSPDKPYNPGYVAHPDWYLQWDYCAGFICNWGVHHLDIAHWGCPSIATEPCEIECQGVYRKKGLADNIESWHATFTFSSGLKMIFTDTTKQKIGIRFVGDKGWVHVDRAGIWFEPESLMRLKLKEEDLHLYESRHHHVDFLSSVRSRKDPVSNVHATHVATYLSLIAEIAARLETKLQWDPKREEFINNNEANQRLTRPMFNGWKL